MLQSALHGWRFRVPLVWVKFGWNSDMSLCSTFSLSFVSFYLKQFVSLIFLVPRYYDKPRFLRKHLTLDNEEGFKLDRRRFSEMNLTAKPLSHRPYYGYSMDELKLPEGRFDASHFQSTYNNFSIWFVFLAIFRPFILPWPNFHTISHFIFGAVARTEQAKFPYAERFSYLLDVLNNASTSEEKELVHISTKCNEQDR